MIFGKKTAKPNRKALVALDALLAGRKRSPNIVLLAKFIEEHLGFKTRIIDWTTNTDYKPPGFRYITRPGKGRKGKKLYVYLDSELPSLFVQRTIFEHTTSETYATNDTVVRWIREYAEGWRVPRDDD